MSSVKELLTARRASEERAQNDTIDLIEATLPAWRIATLDHVTRAKRISLASIIARIRKGYAPADDHAKLRRLMEMFPNHYENSIAGLHRLEGQIRELSGWRLNPPVTSDMGLLRNMAPEPMDQALIRAELGASFNPCSLLAIAFENVAAVDKFGDVSLEDDAEKIAKANDEVAEVLEALRSQPPASARRRALRCRSAR